jgi:phenylpropionate dioxygenase-like ring-hydroxylating dioxygenase large terminal subunit
VCDGRINPSLPWNLLTSFPLHPRYLSCTITSSPRHEYFLENVVDPAHVPVSHHGIVGEHFLTSGVSASKRMVVL